ncbi:MAG: cell envelope biogenesis protein OmpA [Flavobacteriaceae bacterium]|nr:MAG: cell envelope biogenesis protein OmpA [Flavobacteriaceae bacterium]
MNNLEPTAKNNIKSRVFTNLEGVDSGFYIVANVYKNKVYLNKYISDLKNKGIAANYVFNPNNGLNYAYLKHYNHWEDALKACETNLNGRHQEKVWIMIVNNDVHSITTTPKPIKDLVVTVTEIFHEKKVHANKKADFHHNKIIKKADEYFNKMWYAEAAELYEKALYSNKEFYTLDILQKTGDSHYFNTNMERAFYWYNILYEKYENTVSVDVIFKYAHTLKSAGKYSRSKRLMRLYNQRYKSSGSKDRATKSNNATILDNILNQEDRYEVKNLVINSRYSEFSPMFYNEDQIVFSSSKDTSVFTTNKYKWNNQPYLDLYAAKLNKESNDLRRATKFSKKINTKYHEASVTFSPDNETMYFTRNNYGKKLKRDKKGINNLKIYMSKKRAGEWSEAVEVSFNSDEYSTGHPALSPDGKKLYFVSDMPGSIGMTDIFVVDVLEDGLFSQPKNLGPEINTERREMFPFINDKKLYFSSNGHVGLGGLDVFETTIDEENGFNKVENVGAPVNSRKDDFSYIINEETQKGFFASNRTGGKGDDDIYSFARLIPEEVEENAIAGVVTELITGNVMPKAMVILLDENNIKLKEMMAGVDGGFIFEDLDGNTKYTIATKNDNYLDEEIVVSTQQNEVVNVELSLRKLKEKIVIENGIKKLKTDLIYFNFDKSFIRQDAALELDKLVEVMTEHKNMVIKIESHTDSWGPSAYNKVLSDKRAKSSRDYLVQKGIAPERIESAIGYGEERLLNECENGVPCGREKHKRNRRSEFIIVEI